MSSHGVGYCRREDAVVDEAERRVQLVDVGVLQAARRVVRCSKSSAVGGVASKYYREQSAFRELNT
jgi:hypothetical protein